MPARAERQAAAATAVSNAPALRVVGLAKRFGTTPVIEALDLEVAAGAAFGLVGVNGAGKTTLIKCVLDLCASDAGRVEIFGTVNRLPGARLRLGYVPERFLPPHYLRCREFLELTLALAGERFARGQAETLLAELELDPGVIDRPVRQLSKGMTQKLGLAGCLLVPRDLYVLDEPMSDLDPASRVAVKSVLVRLVAGGRTLFFTSHVLADVEELCTSIAVLHRGGIGYLGTPAALCERYGEARLERAFIRCIKADGDRPARSI
jgi:ABC-2 type transport system ATP-binding protein